MADRIVYGSPYGVVRGRALKILEEVGKEYRDTCYHTDVKNRTHFEKYSKAVKVAELYENMIISTGSNFGYISLFMLTTKGVCKKAIMDCVKILDNHPEVTFNADNVSSFMGSVLWTKFTDYSTDKGIPYVARVTLSGKMIASPKLGETNETVKAYLKRHRIPFDVFDGCVQIR